MVGRAGVDPSDPVAPDVQDAASAPDAGSAPDTGRSRDSRGTPSTHPGLLDDIVDTFSTISAPNLSAALVLGWSGAAALVLAAAYLVRLSIVEGWLTPGRQVTGAGIVGLVLVGAGLALRLRDRAYAGLLGAAGVAVLYLAVFAAHLHHGLIGPGTATGLAVGVAALSLGLHALHRGALFVSLALAGSYATPLLVPGGGDLADLAVYLTIWNIVYGALALVVGRRAVYLAALYASLIVFDLAAIDLAVGEWRVEAAFQAFQFALFGAVVIAYAVRHRSMSGWLQPLLHYGALVLFYGFEYSVLNEHLSEWAPGIAVGFAVTLYGAWMVAGRIGEIPTPVEPPTARSPRLASLRVVHSFGALVLFHAVWVDAVPWAWRPAAAIALAAALVAIPRVRPAWKVAWRPWWVAAGLLFVAGWIHLSLGWAVTHDELELRSVLAVLWPLWLYAEYARRPIDDPEGRPVRLLLIGVAHLLALAGWALLVERWLGDPSSTVERLWLSMGWAGIGVAVLIAAARRGDHLLARSSLGIFALFAGKVAFVDLDRTAALVRVGILAVLGAALYAGGWIYRRVIEPEIGTSG